MLTAPRTRLPAMTRTQWLTRRVSATDLMTALGLDDGYCGTLSTLSRIAAAAWREELPYAAWVAASGLLWAIDTGRIPLEDYVAIKRLWARPLCQVVADVAEACPSPLDVPHYLIARAPGLCW